MHDTKAELPSEQDVSQWQSIRKLIHTFLAMISISYFVHLLDLLGYGYRHRRREDHVAMRDHNSLKRFVPLST
jgi:hypothetical protein